VSVSVSGFKSNSLILNQTTCINYKTQTPSPLLNPSVVLFTNSSSIPLKKTILLRLIELICFNSSTLLHSLIWIAIFAKELPFFILSNSFHIAISFHTDLKIIRSTTSCALLNFGFQLETLTHPTQRNLDSISKSSSIFISYMQFICVYGKS
jgi:hypothetical protein